MSYKDDYKNKGEGKEIGKPHVDCYANFRLWHEVFSGRSFQKKLEQMEAKVIEFFRFNGKEEKYYKFLPSYLDAQGNRYPPRVDAGTDDPKNPGQKIWPDWYGVSPRGEITTSMIPLCVQISSKSGGKNHCANINFQQTNDDFKKDTSYYLKIDWEAFFRK